MRLETTRSGICKVLRDTSSFAYSIDIFVLLIKKLSPHA